MPIVEQLLGWAGDHGKEGAQLAIAWMLAQPAVTSCIVGAKTPEQATYNAAAQNGLSRRVIWLRSQGFSVIFC
ncbi:MAG TPA: aldo/keto reductase [Candidatus Latescibacteria bacterium]|jgi:aryl-alcohol dehydrogenase-like predicted oxidoreductase|nr:aldo/keto reductase [Candidatus Latescibacterota bacterium]HJP32468.1 aldo/keto reductase [Candidatus Latescibacterota bacterium]